MLHGDVWVMHRKGFPNYVKCAFEKKYTRIDSKLFCKEYYLARWDRKECKGLWSKLVCIEEIIFLLGEGGGWRRLLLRKREDDRRESVAAERCIQTKVKLEKCVTQYLSI